MSTVYTIILKLFDWRLIFCRSENQGVKSAPEMLLVGVFMFPLRRCLFNLTNAITIVLGVTIANVKPPPKCFSSISPNTLECRRFFMFYSVLERFLIRNTIISKVRDIYTRDLNPKVYRYPEFYGKKNRTRCLIVTQLRLLVW